MPEKEGQAIEMKDLTSTSFGYIIGFLLPGLLGLYGLSMWSKQVEGLLKPAASTDATIGPSFFLLLSALTMGLFLAAIRFYLFEKLLCRRHRFPKDMFKELSTEDKLVAFKAVVDEHYRYHQFYGSCGVALLIFFPRWIWGNWARLSGSNRVSLCAVFIVFEVILGLTARDAFIRYVERGNAIVVNSQVTLNTCGKEECTMQNLPLKARTPHTKIPELTKENKEHVEWMEAP